MRTTEERHGIRLVNTALEQRSEIERLEQMTRPTSEIGKTIRRVGRRQLFLLGLAVVVGCPKDTLSDLRPLHELEAAVEDGDDGPSAA